MTSTERKFVIDFKEVVQALGDLVQFSPHYDIHAGVVEAAEKDCSNVHKYCYFGNSGVSGK